MAREQKEYETALAHRDELKSQIVQFRHDINQINPQIEKMAPLQGLLKEVLVLKQEYLRTNDHPLQQKFFDLEKDILNSKRILRILLRWFAGPKSICTRSISLTGYWQIFLITEGE